MQQGADMPAKAFNFFISYEVIQQAKHSETDQAGEPEKPLAAYSGQEPGIQQEHRSGPAKQRNAITFDIVSAKV